MAAWIFQANPDRFDIAGYLAAALPRITWSVKRYAKEMAVGDDVYLWQSAGAGRGKAGSESGVVALARIDSAPWHGPDHPEAMEYWRTPGDAEAVDGRIWLVVDSIADRKGVVRREWLLDDPVCRDLPILKQPAGTNYPVPPEMVPRMLALWRRTGEDWSRAESIAALRTYHRTYGGPLSRASGSPVATLALLIGRAVGGAYNKILNFRAIDPRDARQGLDGAGQTDRMVWAEFYDAATETIRAEALEGEYQRLWALAPDGGDAGAGVDDFEAVVRVQRSRSLEDLLAAYARRPRDPRPRSIAVASVAFDRDPLVVAIARKRAGDRCEVPGCSYVPFLTVTGEPYVEVHHIVTLADGGPDTTENAACLCPTHHRELHYGRAAEPLRRALVALRAGDPPA